MRICGLLFALLLSGSAAFSQTQIDSNTITVTAYQTTTMQPDQVVFSVDVTSDFNTNLDDVIAALSTVGITATNFVGVNASSQFNGTPAAVFTGTGLDWSFSLPVGWAQMKTTMAALNALQKTITQSNSALILAFGVFGTQVSSQLQQMQTCSPTGLIAAATDKAQKLASAANLFVGAVLGMSAVASTGTPSSLPLGYSIYPTTCSITVKFAVTR